MAATHCSHCTNPVPLAEEHCPHCGRPGLYPNVRAAEQPEEQKALDRRYQDSVDQATARGCPQLADFETAMAEAQAVIARPLEEAARLASKDNEIYGTFYQWADSGIRLPKGDKWDTLRALADDALFPNFRKGIRFAALTVDGKGLANYGECFLLLREDMIAHRASVLEENAVGFMRRHGGEVFTDGELPKGYRAIWAERGKLAVAKLADQLQPDTDRDSFPGLLLAQGTTTEDDSFVEVHIWGPMTRRSLARVVMAQRPTRRGSRVMLKGLREKLAKVGVELEIV